MAQVNLLRGVRTYVTQMLPILPQKPLSLPPVFPPKSIATTCAGGTFPFLLNHTSEAYNSTTFKMRNIQLLDTLKKYLRANLIEFWITLRGFYKIKKKYFFTFPYIVELKIFEVNRSKKQYSSLVSSWSQGSTALNAAKMTGE